MLLKVSRSFLGPSDGDVSAAGGLQNADPDSGKCPTLIPEAAEDGTLAASLNQAEQTIELQSKLLKGGHIEDYIGEY